MGRGPRSEVANRSASSLLFGPRSARQTLNTTTEASIFEMKAALDQLNDDKPEMAIDLMLRFNDQAMDESPDAQALHEGMKRLLGDYALGHDRLQEGSWRKLIDGLGQEIAKDGSVKAFDDLAPSLAMAFNARCRQAPGQTIENLDPADKAFLLETDHPLTNEIIKDWGQNYPNQALTFGVKKDNYSDDKHRAARQGFYQDLRKEQPRFYLSDEILGDDSPLLSDQVKEDLADGSGAPLADQIFKSSQDGGLTLFGKRSARIDQTSPIPREEIFASLTNRVPIGQEQLYARLLERLPESEQQECRRERNWYLGWAANKSFGSPSQLATSLNLGPEGKQALIDHHQNWTQAGQEEMEKAIISGQRTPRLYQEQERIGKIIAAHSKASGLNKAPLFNDNPRNPDLPTEWRAFQDRYLSRRLAPDRKLDIGQDDWQKIITHSLRRVDGNPFNFAVDGKRLLINLADHLDSQQEQAATS